MGGGSKTVVPLHFWDRLQRPVAKLRERSTRVYAVTCLPTLSDEVHIFLDLRCRASNTPRKGGRTPTIVFLGDEEAMPIAPSGRQECAGPAEGILPKGGNYSNL